MLQQVSRRGTKGERGVQWRQKRCQTINPSIREILQVLVLQQRRAWDSNPEVLSDAGFQGGRTGFHPAIPACNCMHEHTLSDNSSARLFFHPHLFASICSQPFPSILQISVTTAADISLLSLPRKSHRVVLRDRTAPSDVSTCPAPPRPAASILCSDPTASDRAPTAASADNGGLAFLVPPTPQAAAVQNRGKQTTTRFSTSSDPGRPSGAEQAIQ